MNSSCTNSSKPFRLMDLSYTTTTTPESLLVVPTVGKRTVAVLVILW